MKKQLQALFIFAALMFAFTAANADITITFVVNLGDTAPGPNGVHVAGTFATEGSSTITSDWAPDAAGSAFTNTGGTKWSLTVTFPDSTVGDTLQFKFLSNNAWGTDETHIDTSCGIGGLGSANRFLVIPDVNMFFTANFNQCGTLSLTGIQTIQPGIASLDLYPNPALNFTQITYGLAVNDNVTLTLRSFTGQVLRTLVNKVQSPGMYRYNLNTDDLATGVYFVQINVKGATFDKRFVVNR